MQKRSYGGTVVEVYSHFWSKSQCSFMTLWFLCLQAVEDVNVTFEDQKKINTFARNTNRTTELKDEIEAKKVRVRPIFSLSLWLFKMCHLSFCIEVV